MKLSRSQIQFISSILNQNEISIQSLHDDLLDHLCCYVESRMNDTNDFEQLVKDGLKDVAPFGLKLLQQETLLLIHSDKLSIMKKFMFIVGALSAMSWSTGTTFQLMHLPGGSEFSFYGFLTFVFVFLPLLAREQAVLRKPPMEKWKFILGMGSGILFAVCFTFKRLHLAGTTELLIAATVFLVFVFVPFLFISMYKKSLMQRV